MKKSTLMTVAVVLLLAAAAAWAIKKRQAGMTAPVKLSSGSFYSVDSAYNFSQY